MIYGTVCESKRWNSTEGKNLLDFHIVQKFPVFKVVFHSLSSLIACYKPKLVPLRRKLCILHLQFVFVVQVGIKSRLQKCYSINLTLLQAQNTVWTTMQHLIHETC